MSMRRFWLRCRERGDERGDERGVERCRERGDHTLQNELHKAKLKGVNKEKDSYGSSIKKTSHCSGVPKAQG